MTAIPLPPTADSPLSLPPNPAAPSHYAQVQTTDNQSNAAAPPIATAPETIAPRETMPPPVRFRPLDDHSAANGHAAQLLPLAPAEHGLIRNDQAIAAPGSSPLPELSPIAPLEPIVPPAAPNPPRPKPAPKTPTKHLIAPPLPMVYDRPQVIAPPTPETTPPKTTPQATPTPIAEPIPMPAGSITSITVEGNQRLADRFIRSRIARGLQTPLNYANLEAQLRLLRLNPLFEQVTASLRPGPQIGQNQLIVRVVEAKSLTGGISLDNAIAPSIGRDRVNLQLGTRNLTGNGDELDGFYSRSFNGAATSYGLSYQIPLSPQDNTLQLRAEHHHSTVTQAPFAALGIRGSGELYEVSYRQPLRRTLREELALSIGLTVQSGQTFTFNTLPTPFGIGPDADGISRTSVLRFGQEYIHRDRRGTWNLRSQFNFGTRLFRATQNDSPLPDGQFFSWTAQAQRVQRLGAGHLLIAQSELQLTPNALLPSQQFLIGGAQSVRGYRQNARSGDNGLRLALEARITLAQTQTQSPTVQIAPFVEAGIVWNHPDNPNRLPRQTTLVTTGLGLIFTPNTHLQARLDYGIPLINLNDRGNSIQDHGFHFRLNYRL